jgi:hypothetical protein
MKFIMTICLNYAVKRYNLLFKKHFENRKSIVSKHALNYIVETINSIWVNKKTAIMLLLNVIGVFNNVLHFRLLHNLKKRLIKNIYLVWVNDKFFSDNDCKQNSLDRNQELQKSSHKKSKNVDYDYSSKWCGLNSHQSTVTQADVSYTVGFQKFNSTHFFWITVVFLWVFTKPTLKKILVLSIVLLETKGI